MISFIIRELLNSSEKSAKFPAREIKFLVDNLKPPKKMHILQPKHIKIKEKEAEEILEKLNVSKAQLPKILSTDPGLPEECSVGDIIKIERKDEEEGKVNLYYRVVV